VKNPPNVSCQTKKSCIVYIQALLWLTHEDVDIGSARGATFYTFDIIVVAEKIPHIKPHSP
jgi:hypothetical protein